jgi:hypothetical protein
LIRREGYAVENHRLSVAEIRGRQALLSG